MAKAKVNKKTTYFIIAVAIFGIIPLAFKQIGKNSSNATAAPDTTVQVKENNKTQYGEKVSRPAQIKYEFKENTAADETGTLKRDPFLIARGILKSQPEAISTGFEENPGEKDLETAEVTSRNPLEGMELKGILIDGTEKYALINDKLFRENQDVNGMKIAFIKEDEVGFYSNGTTYILRIKE